jgi:hypothetical protein
MKELRPPTREDIDKAIFQLRGVHLDDLHGAEIDRLLPEVVDLLPDNVREYCAKRAGERFIAASLRKQDEDGLPRALPVGGDDMEGRWVAVTELTADEANDVLPREYVAIETDEQAEDFLRLQSYFRKKYGVLIREYPNPHGLAQRRAMTDEERQGREEIIPNWTAEELRELGDAGVNELHRKLLAEAEASDWHALELIEYGRVKFGDTPEWRAEKADLEKKLGIDSKIAKLRLM